MARPDSPSPPVQASIKASLLGAVAAALVAPVFWFGLVLLRPGGFWTRPLDVIVAAPAIWLFAGLIAIPVSLVLGPLLLAVIFRFPRPQLSACVLGAIAGAAILYALPVLVGRFDTAFHPEQSAFGAAMGAVGAWAATRFMTRFRRRAAVEN